jgi:glycosyltransferase involved in cell wall biosynthesis
MGSEMTAFARAARGFIPEPTLFLTPQAADAERFGVTRESADIRTVEPPDVPGWLRRARSLFFFIRPTPAKRASCPTKFAEGLAVGLPIVCNRGIGDLDEIVEHERIGILVNAFSEFGYREAGQRLRDLLGDPQLTERCRGVAEVSYSLNRGVNTYCDLYRALGEFGQRGESSPSVAMGMPPV